jgi:DNA-dependent metalloprotease WSS1
MALQNTIRLNHQKSSHPNDRIIFIKPLPRPSTPQDQTEYQTADLFLRAIAAQCLPIMKTHWLTVTTLEEYEPNREFLGRNFNHGECIQLVLRRKGGGWLGFEMVQMVMMHELAHCREMNHSKRFWEVRNTYAGEMRALWNRGFTGEGLWGGGRVLGDLSGRVGGAVPSGQLDVLEVCGGTFRSRGRRKRRRGNGGGNGEGGELTWKEKKERRIEKKFGKNGVSLGGDEDRRMVLEIGGRVAGTGNPRVAQSKRGRELRAAAALARFEQSKQDAVKKEKEADEGSEQGDGEDYEDVDSDAGAEDAVDLDGQRLLDARGGSMVRVCGEEDEDEVHVKQELEEMEGLERYFPRLKGTSGAAARSSSAPAPAPEINISNNNHDDGSDATTATESPSPGPSRLAPASSTSEPHPQSPAPANSKTTAAPPQAVNQNPPSRLPATTTTKEASPTAAKAASTDCPICSLTNDPLVPTCAACGHVLDTRRDPLHWRCQGEACRGSEYVNAGDAGVCGLCGERRSA